MVDLSMAIVKGLMELLQYVNIGLKRFYDYDRSGKNVTLNVNEGQSRVICKTCFHIHSWQKFLTLRDYDTEHSAFPLPRLSPTVSITVEDSDDTLDVTQFQDNDNGNGSPNGNGKGPDDLEPYSYGRCPADLTPGDIEHTAKEWEQCITLTQTTSDTELELFLVAEMTENGAKGAAAEARSNAAVKGSLSSTEVLVVAEQVCYLHDNL